MSILKEGFTGICEYVHQLPFSLGLQASATLQQLLLKAH